ncbi:succinyldiaminopimelate aminotransferase [Pelistega indica]|uniref:Succinyldiaminopimelate aminotransferase n=1 Tax=Pelistega indica TaxID=1414851 RepID=V8G9M1_9BURK|nr:MULTISPECIES: succinyldiaminopimelate transaminase [Pelistega]ETD73100.1 succinyldiaminopimelate aminotransferase [Pelistega indica]
MNPNLNLLQPYPFERLRALFAGVEPIHYQQQPINLSIGEPKHETPQLIKQAIIDNLTALSAYPATKGDVTLRQAISAWIARRYNIPAPNPETEILPCLGSREALFSFTQVVIGNTTGNLVVSPNPFYQIYEGAAYLGGAQPYFVNSDPARNFAPNWASVPEDVWKKTKLLFVCSPGNPAGNVTPLEEWQYLFELSDKYGFVIASDECYSEIYFNEKPLGILQAAQLSGRTDYKNMICFSSLSKRSNVPGMRSGFVAGDKDWMALFLKYRTYHGSAMSGVISAASVVAWNDESHVEENRRLYQEKFTKVFPILAPVLDVNMPDASFYLWAGTPIDDTEFSKSLFKQANVALLPGSFLSRPGSADGINPGFKRVRIALVAPVEQCVEGAERIAEFVRKCC